MIRNAIAVLFLSFTVGLNAQEHEVLRLFLDQVDAYNDKDIQGMTDNLHPDFKWYYITSDSLIQDVIGQEAFKKSMTSYYESLEQVESSIEGYTIEGNRISFKEVVRYTTKSGKSGIASAMGVYHLKDGKIWRAYYFY